MWLVCGLGNPGKKYMTTRHNLGFDIIDSIVKKNQISLVTKDKKKEMYKGDISKYNCIFCKPLTYMNNSGVLINQLSKFYKIPISKIIVIHDDLDLKVGKIKIKIGGGNAGHNGLLSIDENIGKNYKRIRIGIGRPEDKKLISSYVLKKFTKQEKELIDIKIKLLNKFFYLVFEKKNLFLTKIAIQK